MLLAFDPDRWPQLRAFVAVGVVVGNIATSCVIALVAVVARWIVREFGG